MLLRPPGTMVWAEFEVLHLNGSLNSFGNKTVHILTSFHFINYVSYKAFIVIFNKYTYICMYCYISDIVSVAKLSGNFLSNFCCVL